MEKASDRLAKKRAFVAPWRSPRSIQMKTDMVRRYNTATFLELVQYEINSFPKPVQRKLLKTAKQWWEVVDGKQR